MPGWLSQLSHRLSTLARVMISRSWDQAMLGSTLTAQSRLGILSLPFSLLLRHVHAHMCSLKSINTIKKIYTQNYCIIHRKLLSIVTMLYIKSSELILLIAASLYPLDNIIPFPLPLGPWQSPFYSLCLGVWLFKTPRNKEWIVLVLLCLTYST